MSALCIGVIEITRLPVDFSTCITVIVLYKGISIRTQTLQNSSGLVLCCIVNMHLVVRASLLKTE